MTTPVLVHHAKRDGSVPYIWSELLATELELQGKDYTFYSYDSDHHLFRGEERNTVVSRDIAFFRSLMKEPAE